MIKLSKLTDYAILILYEMAKDNGARASAAALSTRTHLPEPTVAKLLKLLNKQGVITSTRGVNGGYLLEKAPEDIPITEVIMAIEGPVAITTCVDEHPGENCAMEQLCPLKNGWQAVNDVIAEALERVTLADMVRGCA